MTFLDKGGNKDSLGGRPDNALRAVKAKREADEADKEYRKAVHWMETLRLRRTKILEGGYKVCTLQGRSCSPDLTRAERRIVCPRHVSHR